MNAIIGISSKTLRQLWRAAAMLPLGLGLTGMFLLAAQSPAHKNPPAAFATPREAIQALIDASERNDTPALMHIFGPEGKDIVQSGDPAEDEADRAAFARLAREKLHIEQDPSNPDRALFSIGEQEAPFPAPLIRKNGKWLFDSAQARTEILAHRIGANELNVVDVCRGFVEAETEYAADDRDGDGLLKYAQTIDALYKPGAAASLVPKAFANAVAGPGRAVPTPYHGYYFRILKAQGPDAAGSALNYLVDGKMIGGFALVAWPADYGVSGIQTFIVNHDGVVYQKDFGANSAAFAKQMSRFNPDKSWKRVDLE